MKSHLIKIYAFVLGTLVLVACQKDEERVVIRPGAAPVLSVSNSTLVLDKANADQEAIAFSWTPADFGFKAAVKYILQLDKKGNNFAATRNVDLGGSLQKKYTVAEFNSLLGQLELAPGSAGQVEARVKSELVASIEPTYSPVTTITATPYVDIIDYPSLYVPGSYQNWTPATAAKISSVKDDKNYEGYVYFPNANTYFKITSNPDWDHTNYGDGGTGKLSATGGDLLVADAGYYRLKADLNAMTWSATKTAWGVIGDATGSWDNDQDMTYDAAAQVWKATLTLSPGAMKFRANDAWDINLGDFDPANGLLNYNGKDIPITEAGQYEIVMDLSIPGNYRYSLKKL